MIKIVGAKGIIQDVDGFLEKVLSFSEKQHVVVQVFNADTIYGRNHLISAVEHAVRATQERTNTTNSLSMEIMLYASGERQLKLAIPKMGVRKGKGRIAFVFTNGKISDKIVDDLLKELVLERDDKVLEGDRDTLKKFGLTDAEIRTVTKDKYGDLILEKVAMVDIIK